MDGDVPEVFVLDLGTEGAGRGTKVGIGMHYELI